MNMTSITREKTYAENLILLSSLDGEERHVGDVIGRQVQLDINAVSISRPDHAAFEFVTSFLIHFSDGLKMVLPDPVHASILILHCNSKIIHVHPAIQVHLKTKLLRCMSENEGHDAAKALTFSIGHDEFAFLVGSGTVRASEETMATLTNHARPNGPGALNPTGIP